MEWVEVKLKNDKKKNLCAYVNMFLNDHSLVIEFYSLMD